MFKLNKLKQKKYKKDVVYSPLSGTIIPLEDVNDSVFSSKMMGEGFAIEPDDGKVYSPINGKVVALFPTNHAIGIENEYGIQLIIHVGINTVELNGYGFQASVNQGDTVEIGDLLLSTNFRKIPKEYELTTMVVIENSSDFNLKLVKTGKVSVGDEILQVSRNVI